MEFFNRIGRKLPVGGPFALTITSSWSIGAAASCVKTRKAQCLKNDRRYCSACSWMRVTGFTSPATSNIPSSTWSVPPITYAVPAKHSANVGHRASASVNACFPALSHNRRIILHITWVQKSSSWKSLRCW